MNQIRLLTDWELSQAPFPYLPSRLSHRRSRSRTEPVAPRSFSDLRLWTGFLANAAQFATTHLDNTSQRNPEPLETIDPLRAAADEIGVRVPLEGHVFSQTNRLARRLGLQFMYDQGGSNRSFSYTDLVILDCSQPHPRADAERTELSSRIFCDGEAKGPWQWDIAGNRSLEEAFGVSEDQEKLTHVIQKVFGDMILDESRYGFISNYNQTVFLRRCSGTSKALEFSPIVRIGDAPIEKFLFVLHLAETEKAMKPQFSRLLVQETPPAGYKVILPRLVHITRSGRRSVRALQSIQVRHKGGGRNRQLAWAEDDATLPLYEEEDFKKIPTANMEELGISGRVIGLGKYGNVIEGEAEGVKLALKLFDLHCEQAAVALVREQTAYQKLRALQGTHIPALLGVGRLPHCNIIFLAVTDEWQHDVGKKLRGKGGMQVERRILAVLNDIHMYGVLHNDLRLSHVMWRGGPKFIDFESSNLNAASEDLIAETRELEALLADVRDEACETALRRRGARAIAV